MIASSTSLRAWVNRRRLPLAGLAVVAAARLATLPQSVWELDEVLFCLGVERFDPPSHRPHPPGYPLVVGLGKLVDLLLHDPYRSLVVVSVVASLAAYPALVVALRSWAEGVVERPESAAVAGALLFQLSPAMLVHGPLALSDSPALFFLALALAAAASVERRGRLAAWTLGAAAAAAIGCRPQLAVPVLPMLVVALWPLAPRLRLAVAGAFTLVALGWFVPLLVAVGGLGAFPGFLARQAAWVAAVDAGALRAAWPLPKLAARFLLHPWGSVACAVPVVALAALGLWRFAVLRRRAVLPAVAFTAVHCGLAFAVMDPSDGVRYALPALVLVAAAAAVGAEWLAGRLGRPALAPAALVLLAAGFVVYAWPILRARAAGPSPAAQAIAWAGAEAPRRAIYVVDAYLEPYLAYLRPGATSVRFDDGRGLERHAALRGRPFLLLSHGESGWPDARTFRWPESAAYDRLTRGHYRVVSVSPIPAGRRYLAERGVYDYEPSAFDPRWRWLDQEAVLRVYPRGARSLAVTLDLPVAAALPRNGVLVSVDGRAAARVELARGESRTVTVPLPRAASAELELRADQTFVPGNGDRRRLAVRLLALAPLP